MIKISQLPAAQKSDGNEVVPVVQGSETRKAKAVFIGPDSKITIPAGIDLVTVSNGKEIKLLSAKVVNDVATVYVGDNEVALSNGDSIVVVEDKKADGNAYIRIDNSWAIRNPITRINSKAPLTGGGPVTITASDLQAHIENINKDSKAYVSVDGVWTELDTIMIPELNKKANVSHVHEIANINDLQNILTRIEQKADNYAHIPAYCSLSSASFTAPIGTGIVMSDKQSLVDVTHSNGIVSITKPGYYMVTISGTSTSTGDIAVQKNDVDISTLKAPLGTFSIQDIIEFAANDTLKIRYTSSDELNLSFVLTAHRM